LKKLVLLAALLALVVVAALPAIAAANGNDNNGNNNNNHHDNNNRHNNNDNNGGGTDFSQTNEQDVQSGDSSQTFNVTGGGDNSNQCVGLQGISNTGNSATNTGVLQYGSDGDVETSGGDFTISPSSTTTCDQKVDQAASASGW
jgi:hypothetical protein